MVWKKKLWFDKSDHLNKDLTKPEFSMTFNVTSQSPSVTNCNEWLTCNHRDIKSHSIVTWLDHLHFHDSTKPQNLIVVSVLNLIFLPILTKNIFLYIFYIWHSFLWEFQFDQYLIECLALLRDHIWYEEAHVACVLIGWSNTFDS